MATWPSELCIDTGIYSCSLITALAIHALAECAYQKPLYTLYRTCADEYVFIVHWTCVILGFSVLSRSSLTFLRYPGPSRGCVLGEVGQLISLDLVPP